MESPTTVAIHNRVKPIKKLTEEDRRGATLLQKSKASQTEDMVWFSRDAQSTRWKTFQLNDGRRAVDAYPLGISYQDKPNTCVPKPTNRGDLFNSKLPYQDLIVAPNSEIVRLIFAPEVFLPEDLLELNESSAILMIAKVQLIPLVVDDRAGQSGIPYTPSYLVSSVALSQVTSKDYIQGCYFGVGTNSGNFPAGPQ